MSLFDRIFRPKEEKDAEKNAHAVFHALSAYTPVFTSWGGAIYESELVRAAIDARARHISKLKIETYGSAKPSLQAQLRLGPNAWQTWSQFLYRTSTILDIHNTAFIIPVMDKDLNTTGYFTALPEKCEIKEYKNKLWLRYEFAHRQFAAVEMDRVALLTKFQYKNDFFGSDNKALHETMQLIHLNNEGIKEAVKNSATFRFMAQLTNFAQSEDLAKEQKRFVEENIRNATDGGILLFPNKYSNVQQINSKPYTVDDKQLELIETNVSNYFGVSPEVLQNKAIGDAWSAFYEGAIEPFAIQFSESMTKAAFSERERSLGSGIMATANRLQYMSNNDKLQVSAQMADRGLMTINEIREIWNLAPVDGGDVRTLRGEYYQIDENGNVIAKENSNEQND